MTARTTLAQRYARNRHPPGHPERRGLAQALARDTGSHLDWMALAFEEFSAHAFRTGHAALNEVTRRAPDFLPAHWLRFQYPLDVVQQDAATIDEFRRRWAAGIAAFERLDFNDPRWQPQVWGCLGSCTAFYRHYIDDDVHAEQQRYGALLQRMMAALDRGEPPRPMRRGRRRVLFCSPYFYRHTVARLFVPLIEALDRSRFDIHCLHFGVESDAMTARAGAIGTLHGGPRDAFAWRRLIGELAPDVIVYLDLGMHPLPQALAALRLAPVQACLWGHPVSTGLSTIDAVLSPDAFEPADAQRHYGERLVRLPAFGHGLDPPDMPVAEPPAAAQADATLDLLCGQSIYKLMPVQDRLFARILAGLPQARLQMIPHADPAVHAALRERMRPVFAEHGVDVDRRVQMHGYGPLEHFLALARGCALNLDSVGWSGGMSSLDLLALGLPTVSWPGQTMRTRQTAAMLQRLGVPELVVDSEDGYVEQAIALGRDGARRATLAQRIRDGLPQLYGRQRVTDALTDFLATCVPPEQRASAV